MKEAAINAETIDALISRTWQTVIEKSLNGYPLSSEKSLCFLFAMTLFEEIGSALVIDFENQCYEELEGESKYLDLLFYTDNAFKVAIEFKFPRSSQSGASNQPQTRQSIYRDIARLSHLKRHSIKAGACYFLMATNESAYLNQGKYKNHLDLLVHHGHKVFIDNTIIATELPLTGTEFEFNWKSIKKTSKGKYVRDGILA